MCENYPNLMLPVSCRQLLWGWSNAGAYSVFKKATKCFCW